MIFVQIIYPLLIHQLCIVPFTVLFRESPLLSSLLGSMFAIPVLFYLYAGKRPADFCITKEFWKSGICLFVSGIGLSILINNIIMLSGIGRIFTGYEEVSWNLYQPSLLLQIAGIGFIIPLAEELVFRAFAYRCLRSRMGVYLAAFWSAFYFGIYHGNFVQGLYAFIIGLALACVYEHGRTIFAPYILHVSANLTSITVTCLSSELPDRQYAVLYLVLMVMSVLFTAAGFRFFHQYQTSKGEEL